MHDGRTTWCARRRAAGVHPSFRCCFSAHAARSPRFRFTRRVLSPGVDVFAYGLMADGRARLMLNKEAGKPQHPLWRAGARAGDSSERGQFSTCACFLSKHTHVYTYSAHTYAVYMSVQIHIYSQRAAILSLALHSFGSRPACSLMQSQSMHAAVQTLYMHMLH